MHRNTSATSTKSKKKKDRNETEESSEEYDGLWLQSEAPICFHCAKVMELFKQRNVAITFPSNEMKSHLDIIKMTKKIDWTRSDVEYICELYHTGGDRKQKLFA